MVLLTTDGPRRSNPSQAALHPSAPEHGGFLPPVGNPSPGTGRMVPSPGTPRLCQAHIVITWVQAEGGPQPQHPETCLGFLSHRCCLYRDCDLRVESVSHHSGQLPPLYVLKYLEAEAVPAQLLKLSSSPLLHLQLVAVMSGALQLLRGCEARRAQVTQPGAMDIRLGTMDLPLVLIRLDFLSSLSVVFQSLIYM